MSNKHYNGSGGNIRDDHPHTGADYVHSHWYDGDNQNEDFVCVREKEESDENLEDSQDDDSKEASDEYTEDSQDDDSADDYDNDDD